MQQTKDTHMQESIPCAWHSKEISDNLTKPGQRKTISLQQFDVAGASAMNNIQICDLNIEITKQQTPIAEAENENIISSKQTDRTNIIKHGSEMQDPSMKETEQSIRSKSIISVQKQMEINKMTPPMNVVELSSSKMEPRIDLYRNLINSEYLNSSSPNRNQARVSHQLKPKFVHINSSILKDSKKRLREPLLETVHETMNTQKQLIKTTKQQSSKFMLGISTQQKHSPARVSPIHQNRDLVGINSETNITPNPLSLLDIINDPDRIIKKNEPDVYTINKQSSSLMQYQQLKEETIQHIDSHFQEEPIEHNQ